MYCRHLSLVFFAALAASACSSSDKPDAGPTGGGDAAADAGTPDLGAADAQPPDLGPAPCVRDQDCASGEVCNVVTGVCAAGVACTTDTECDACSRLANPTDCGHGYHLTAYCDTDRGSVCTRSLAPCEPCATDDDCGPVHPSISNVTGPQRCVDYPDGKYCARSSDVVGCPRGFQPDPQTNLCIRIAGCPTGNDFHACPAKPAGGPNCTSDQTCPGQPCAGVNGTLCTTNDIPGALGLCIGACQDDGDCPDPAFPTCRPQSGICVPSCTKGGCADSKACHSSGTCGDKCMDDAWCETNVGAETYCNLPGRPAPRAFKGYRDQNSCAPLGCEGSEDCQAGEACDKTQSPPACVPGCNTSMDCNPGTVCKMPGANGPQMSYTLAECRGLATKTDDTVLGVCCNPGCTDRRNGCARTLDWCCGEEDSPFEDPITCGNLRDETSGMVRKAEGGECFGMAPKPVSPFCEICDDMTPCDSDNYDGAGTNWTFGYGVDPAGVYNMGQPFKEQEFCQPVAQDQQGNVVLSFCSVGCNPDLPDPGCPGRTNCEKVFVTCLQDADCNGLTCEGEDTTVNPPRRGQCLCGENNTPFAMCPNQYSGVGDVNFPRCIPNGNMGQMFCLITFQCIPPGVREEPAGSGTFNYPQACLP